MAGPLCKASGFANLTYGCLLGHQQQFETRNYSIACHAGRDYKRFKSGQNCECSRDDFEW